MLLHVLITHCKNSTVRRARCHNATTLKPSVVDLLLSPISLVGLSARPLNRVRFAFRFFVARLGAL